MSQQIMYFPKLDILSLNKISKSETIRTLLLNFQIFGTFRIRDFNTQGSFVNFSNQILSESPITAI
jgi:hypothetical protein